MNGFRSAAVALVLGVASMAASNANATVNVSWADWTNASAGVVGGTITAPSGTVGVTYSGAYSFAQVNNTGTDYWVDNGYTQGVVNRPPTVDLIALDAGGPKTITFSQAVTDPYVAFTSWNGNTVSFSAPFTVISQGCGYWGCGSFATFGGNTGFVGNGEVHGVLQFQGTFTSLSFTDTSENWHGLTVGIGNVAGVPEPATWAMLLVGVFGVGAMLRASRRRHGLTAV